MPHRVLLTTAIDPEAGDHRKPRVVIYDAYLRVLSRVGLAPVLVTPAHDVDGIRSLMGVCQGLILSGGGDIDPGRFGEEPIPGLDEVDPERDAMEWTALDAALAKGVPILGICRGIQVLNVYWGGTLYQDLGSQHPGDLGHRQTAPWGGHHHVVRCTEGSRLHAILAGCEPLRVNSYHHQAVKELAPTLTATAVTEDGLIEGAESTKHDWVVGVQWHPERHEADAPDDDPNIRVMQAFADQVRAWDAATAP